MNKHRLLTIIAVGLLLSNIALVGFIVFRKPPLPPPPAGRPERGEGPKAIIIERLQFTPEQTATYEALIKEHRKEVRETDRKIMDIKQQLYSSLRNNDAPVHKDSLIQAIAQLQAHIEGVHYNHFKDIQNLCTTPQQKEEFEKLSHEINELFFPPKHPPQGQEPHNR